MINSLTIAIKSFLFFFVIFKSSCSMQINQFSIATQFFSFQINKRYISLHFTINAISIFDLIIRIELIKHYFVMLNSVFIKQRFSFIAIRAISSAYNESGLLWNHFFKLLFIFLLAWGRNSEKVHFFYYFFKRLLYFYRN